MDYRALVIEPDAAERRLICEALRDDWRVIEACSMEEAVRIAAAPPLRLVFCDAQIPAGTSNEACGATLLEMLKTRFGSHTQIVLTAAAGNSATALEAILGGAVDYVRKPCRRDAIREISARTFARFIAAAKESADPPPLSLINMPPASPGEQQLIGESEAIISVFKALARSIREDHSKTDPRVEGHAPTFLITGETGTGKELIARLIHRYSRYRHGTFVAVNCSNLSAELADAELFGSMPGAYTGASKEEQPGLWELASGGTIFLDEITEAPRAVLSKLLRVLQDGYIKRLGAKRWIKVNAQVIAASNRNIPGEIKKGHFREDLYHRLNLFNINLPPLRERREDVPLLAAHFARLHSGGAVRFSYDALELLSSFSKDYTWPGNVRELENVVRRAVTESLDWMIYAVDLCPHLPQPTGIEDTSQIERVNKNAKLPIADGTMEGLDERVKCFRRSLLKETLAACDGNITRAARRLKISRPRLYKLLAESERIAS